jgi:hypothetical protein
VTKVTEIETLDSQLKILIPDTRNLKAKRGKTPYALFIEEDSSYVSSDHPDQLCLFRFPRTLD